MDDTTNDKSLFKVSLRVAYSMDRGHRPVLRIAGATGPVTLCAEIPWGIGAFNHFDMEILPQCRDLYSTVLSACYKSVNEWHDVGMAKLDTEEVASAAGQYPCTCGVLKD